MKDIVNPKTGEVHSGKAALWEMLQPTDPAFTKQFTRAGGFKGTAINGTYILRRLTDAFGPCGTGWRFVIEEERIETGHTLTDAGDKAKVHIIRGRIDYRIEGDERNTWRSTSSQFGQTMFVDKNKYGVFTDEEAPKKSATDCISKCAVMLGIGADVYLGLFDDNKYVNQRRAEEAGSAAPRSDARAPSASPQQPATSPPAQAQAAAPSTGAVPNAGDLDYARGAFTAIRQQIAQATDPADVDAVMAANVKQLEDIKRIAGEPHWQKLLDSAKARKDMLSPEPEPVP